MLESEKLVSLPADALVSMLLADKDIKRFEIRAYVPQTNRLFEEMFQFEAGVNIFDIIAKLKQVYGPSYLLAFVSRVRTDSGTMHFPMLDFSSSRVEYGVDRAKEVLSELGQKRGAILASGRSYHYYGFDLMSPGAWTDLLTGTSGYPEIGSKYIGHQREEGSCSLRITTNPFKPHTPIVISTIG